MSLLVDTSITLRNCFREVKDMSASIRDINKTLIDKLRLQARLAREERAKTDALFLSIGQGVIAADDQGKIIRINQAAINLLGFRKQELIGKWITVSPIFLHNRPIGAIEIFRDTSLELQSDRMKTDFISIASHQLRTPLSAINTYSHMLSGGYVGPLTDDQASFMKIILSAVERMNELISELLNITRIEAGSITVDSAPCRVDDITLELINELRPRADERSINLTYLCVSKIPTINSDVLLIKEIISNLLSNAVKYTPDKGSIRIDLVRHGNNVIFSVTDNGYGIPTNAQPLIFTKCSMRTS